MTPSPRVSERSLTWLATAVEDRGGAVPGGETTRIQHADQLVKLADARLHDLVAEARRNGVPWQAIGDTLGVTRQAAFKRFNAAVEQDSAMSTAIDLTERTIEVFQKLAVDDYRTVREWMTYTCARELTKRKLMSIWTDVVMATGRLERCTNVVVQTPGGRNRLEKLANRHLLTGPIVQATLEHETGEWIGRIAYNSAGKIVGMHIAPTDAQNLPF